MALHNDVYLKVNSVDLSSYLRDITVEFGAETVDDTAMGDSFRSAASGLKTATLTATFHQAFGSGTPDNTLNGLVGGAAVTVEYAAQGSSISASNPKYSFSAICTAYNPGSGAVGDQQTATASFVAAGAVTRSTS